MLKPRQTANFMPLVEKRSSDGMALYFRPGISQIFFGLFWTGFSSIFLTIGVLGLLGKLRNGWSGPLGPLIFTLMGGLFVLIGLLILLSWTDLRIDLASGTFRYRTGIFPFLKVRDGSAREIKSLEVGSKRVSTKHSSYLVWPVYVTWDDDSKALSLKESRSLEEAVAYARQVSQDTGIRFEQSDNPSQTLRAIPTGLRLESSSGVERIYLPPAEAKWRPIDLVPIIAIGGGVIVLGVMWMSFKSPLFAFIPVAAFDALLIGMFLYRIKRMQNAAQLVRVIEVAPGSVRMYAQGPSGLVNDTSIDTSRLTALPDSDRSDPGTTNYFKLFGNFSWIFYGLNREQTEWLGQWLMARMIDQPPETTQLNA